mmetsp:Transcript_114656/g.357093  ORF Transcript_114656/g.357093 Transcript_114656/m.357093 type:complete len:269 (+) Transcript_114656:185-991(+)
MPNLRAQRTAMWRHRGGEGHSRAGPLGLAALFQGGRERLVDARLLLGVREAQDVVREVQRVDLVQQHSANGGLAHEGLEATFQLLQGHLLTVRREQCDEVVPREGPRLVAFHGLEGLADLLGADREDGSVVHVELHEVVEADPVDILAGFTELRVFHLVLHVLDLKLRWEVAQSAHEVGDLLNGDHAIQDPRLGCVFVLGLDLRVVEVILHVGEEIPILSALEQLDERLYARAPHEVGVRHRLWVDEPLIHGQVVAPTGEGILSLVVH